MTISAAFNRILTWLPSVSTNAGKALAFTAGAVPTAVYLKHRSSKRREQFERQLAAGGIPGLTVPAGPSLARARARPTNDPNMLDPRFNVHPELNGAPSIHNGIDPAPVIQWQAKMHDATYDTPEFDATRAIEEVKRVNNWK